MHKTRQFLPPIPSISPGSYDLYSPRLRLVELPRASLHITGDFEALTRPILDAATRNAGRALDIPQDHIIMSRYMSCRSHTYWTSSKKRRFIQRNSACRPMPSRAFGIFPPAPYEFLNRRLIDSVQVCGTSRHLAEYASQARSRHQADVCGSHDLASERVRGPALLHASRAGPAL
jgi:hypothetical protein